MPLDAWEMRDLAARSPIGLLLPRYVALELRIGYATSRDELVFQKAVRTRPNDLADLSICIRRRQALGYDEGHVGVGLGERVEQERERSVQPDLQRAIIGGAPGFHSWRQELAERVAL